MNKKYQSGIVLVVTLIALVILMLASIALIRSTESSSLIAGSIGFKRDMINQAERTMPVIRTRFISGTLSNDTVRNSNLVGANYSAAILATDATGIPTVLANKTTFDTTYGSNNISDTTAAITVRYVIDRMAFAAGPITVTNNLLGTSVTDEGGNVKGIQGVGGSGGKVTGSDRALYRISMRVSGPRNAETYIQSTFII